MRAAYSSCHCALEHSVPPQIVLTGGPGAGKTAVLELARTQLCSHVELLPEAASLLFRGGFPRREETLSKKAAQRAIFHVQDELEKIAQGLQNSALVVCDRGTLDGLAYWPGPAEEYFADLDTSLEIELARYHAVIHLRTPSKALGYNHRNPQRTETAEQAMAIDEKIAELWKLHPRRFVINNTGDFLEKAQRALSLIENFLPPCCRETEQKSQAKASA